MLVIVVRQNVQCTIQNVLANNLIMNHPRTIIIQSIRKSLNTFVEIAILELQRKISHELLGPRWSGPDRLVRVDQLLGPWIPDSSYKF